MSAELISVVIPCYNPSPYASEAIKSVRRQTHPEWEIVVVDDGSDDPAGVALLEGVERRKMPRIRVMHQEHIGLPSARNHGISEARGRYVIPLDCDDRLEPNMMEVCLRELEAHPEAGFAYFDYRVFGEKNYIEHVGEYNLYRLLDENFMAHCVLLRREAWEDVGGYDEWHLWAYEDWHFFLQLGEKGWYGHYIPQVLFNYRTHHPGHHYTGLENHEKNWAHMVESRPALLSPEGRLNVKRQWSPSICFVVRGRRVASFENQTVRDYQVLVDVDERTALERSNAPCFLWMTDERPLQIYAAEECIWGLQAADWVTWTDTGESPRPSIRQAAGPLGVSRRVMETEEPKRSGEVRRIPWPCRQEGSRGVRSKSSRAGTPAEVGPAARAEISTRGGTAAGQQGMPLPARRDGDLSFGPKAKPDAAAGLPSSNSPISLAFKQIFRHLQNAEIHTLDAWLSHPLRSAQRLIPLRFKEEVNRVAGQPVFDLSFYLKFQPRSALIAGRLVNRLDYIPACRSEGRRRIALWTPHLGVGGAENVLLEFARQIDRSRYEVFLLATQSDDSRLRPAWERCADHIYDVSKLVGMKETPCLLYSMAVNWGFDVLVIQNSLPVYSVLPALKQERPEVQVIDILHNVHDDWDFFSATLEVADQLDRRVVISGAGRQRLIDMNISENKIRLIRNGVDRREFDPARFSGERPQRRLGLTRNTKIIVFAGALVERKRPLLLPAVAAELRRLRRRQDYHFVVAGDGPEQERLHSLIARKGVENQFSVLGHVSEIAELLAGASLLLILSTEEGIPLALVEALAMGTPVVSCRAGAIEEALPPACGLLVEPGSGEERRLAEAIHELLRDDDRRAEMGRAGRALAERDYSLERAQRQYRELLTELDNAG